MFALPVPAEIRTLLAALRGAGAEAVVVGGCVRDRLLGRAAHDWDIATSASTSEILAAFPRAVPIGGSHGTALVPSPWGPVDVTPYRASSLAGDLGRRDFTINAIAWDPIEATWHDPAGGRRDLEAGTLRTPGDPRERLAEDPLRALRAARLVASLGLRVDADLLDALGGVAPLLETLPAERVRGELDRLLEAPDCAAGITLLRETGLEAALFPGARADVADLVARLPIDRELRLAAWLRDTRSTSLLARWRFPKERAREVERILAAQPVDEKYHGDAGARRLRRKARGEATVRRIVALRRHELALTGAETTALEALEASLARTAGSALSISQLAMDGRAVIELLEVAPGPIVGRALRHLLERVTEDPALNTREGLSDELRRWHERER